MNIMQLSKAKNLKTELQSRTKWKKALHTCWQEEGNLLDTAQFVEFIHTKYGIELILKYLYETPTIDYIKINESNKALIFQIKYPV